MRRDVAGYHPDVVSRSAEAFAATAGRYVFVSTVDVYADQSVPPVEGAVRREGGAYNAAFAR